MNSNTRRALRTPHSKTLALAITATLLVAAQCEEAALTLSDGPAFTFATTNVGATKLKTFTVTNTGTADAVLGTVSSASLGLAAPFALTGGTCATGALLAKTSGSCTLVVEFKPTTAAAAADELQLRYSWAGSPSGGRVATRPLSGTGTTSTNCFQTGCPAQHACKATTSAPLTGTCVAIPEPPVNCIAPCRWEALRSCTPTLGSCTADRSGLEVLCDPATRWASLYYRLNRVSYSVTQYQGTSCYADRTYLELALHEYTDGSQVIARSYDPAPGQPRVVRCEDDATNYEEAESPECQAWKSAWLQTGCSSITEGSCSGVYGNPF